MSGYQQVIENLVYFAIQSLTSKHDNWDQLETVVSECEKVYNISKLQIVHDYECKLEEQLLKLAYV